MSIGNYSGRGNNAGPAVDFFPLSGASASSPAVQITATTATTGGTTIHTSDAFAQDVLYITLSNTTAASVVVYNNLGSLATTGNQQTTLTAGQSTVAFNGNASISKSGNYSAWSTTTAGIFAFGYVARTYTATA